MEKEDSHGGFRKWRKKVSDAIWKNEILNSEMIDDLFMYNFKKEFDWQSTLEFIISIDDEICRRCRKNEKETWEHIWLCEDNESTIDEIAQESIYKYEKYLEENERKDDIAILRKYNFDFIRILEQRLVVLRGKS
ncbi:hypothetical protein C1646_662623 [Rhizophagus diaphanus]|nr:hypothetical protein C1646_662623 [Rhizophagus diaphanus] [Rhizophagus sp. MUCL 43196]